MLNNAFCRAPEEDVFETCLAMRWHDDQVGRNLLRESTDFIERRTAPKQMAVRWREAVFPRQGTQIIGQHLDVLVFDRDRRLRGTKSPAP